jgi:hypothetical protein
VPETAADLIPGFEPENELEAAVAADAQLLEGLAWGKPRAGHPEGTIAAHVDDLLRTIDEWGETGQPRADLRFISLVHDACKKWVQHWRPKTGRNHHAMRARRVAERYTDDPRLLSTIELHDRPYNLWKKMQRTGRLDEPEFQRMLDQLPDLGLFLRFIELDGSTEGKDPEPVEWLRDELQRRGVPA